MNRIVVEKYIVAFLFVLVFIAFSLAQKDSKKLEKLYLKSTAVKSVFIPAGVVMISAKN